MLSHAMPDTLMLVAILDVMALSIFVLVAFFAIVFLDEDEYGPLLWDVDTLCTDCEAKPAVIDGRCFGCEREAYP